MDAPAELSSRLIGSIFVEKGLITQDQLDTALRMQRETGERLGEIVVAEFGVPRLELASVLAEQWADHERSQESPEASPVALSEPTEAVSAAPAAAGELLLRRPIGEIFVERGFVTDEQLRAAVELQHKTGQRLGEVLVEQGALSRLDLASALAEQWSNVQRSASAPVVADTSESQSPATSPTPADNDSGAVAERLAALEEAVASAVVVRVELDAIASDLRNDLSALEQRLNDEARRQSESELAAVTSQIGALRDSVEERLQSVGTLAERAVDTAQLAELGERMQSELSGLAVRLDAIVADTEPGDALERLAARVDEVSDNQASVRQVFHELGDRVEQLAAMADAQARAADPELGAKVDAVAGQAEAAQSGLASLSSRLDELGSLSARIDGVAAQLPGVDVVDELRRSLTELSEQAAASADRPDQIAALGARLDQLSARLEDLAGRIEGAAAPVTELEAGIDSLARRVDELGQERVAVDLGPVEGRLAALEAAAQSAAELRARMDVVEGRAGQDVQMHDIEALSARLGELEERVGAPADTDVLRAELRSATEASAAAHASLEESLTSRIHEIVGTTSPARDELATLHRRIDEVAAQPAVADQAQAAALDDIRRGLDDVRATVGELGELASRIEDLEAAPAPDAALAPRLDALEETAARLSSVEQRLDEVAGSPMHHELNLRIDSLEARIAGAAGEDALEQLREANAAQSAALQQSIDESRDGAERTTADVARRLDEALGRVDDELGSHRQHADERVRDLDSQLGAIRSEVAELAGAGADRDEWRGRVEAGLSARVDGLEQLISGAAQTTSDEAAATFANLGEGVDDLRRRVEELQALRADDAEGARIAGADLAARIDDVAHRLAENAATAEGALRQELEQLGSRLDETATASSGMEEMVRSEIERLVSSVSWRLEQVEGALRDENPSSSLLEMIERLEQRLDAQAAQAEEQVRVTEKALRKGLASLGAQLAETHATYTESGNALRRSIERLGAAVSESDHRIAESGAAISESDHRIAESGAAPEHGDALSVATEFVAFVPTEEGYRLVVVEGETPKVGAEIEIPEHEGLLVVTRIGRSPLPLDARPCAYLDRRQG